MKTLTTLTVVVAALLITGASYASSNTSRNALAAIRAQQAFQERAEAYALSGESRTVLNRGDHSEVRLVIDGGRNAR